MSSGKYEHGLIQTHCKPSCGSIALSSIQWRNVEAGSSIYETYTKALLSFCNVLNGKRDISVELVCQLGIKALFEVVI